MHYRPQPDGVPLSDIERKMTENLLFSKNAEVMRDEWPELLAMLEAGNKGDFEQETLRPPTLDRWPFYPTSSAAENAAGQ